MKISVRKNTLESPSSSLLHDNKSPLVRKKDKGAFYMSPQQGLEILDHLLQKDYTPKKVKELLDQYLESEDVTVTKNGEIVKKPNWDSRIKGFDRLLKLKKFTSGDDSIPQAHVTTITFNVVNHIGKQKEEPKKEPVIINADATVSE